ncbi:MAG: laccase domain-containing protein [Bacilli bacterium]|nr:laccase domain-containing protein [Bacilli bacterium]
MINNLKIGNAKIVETDNSYGNMNTAAKFFPEGTSEEERKRIFMERRLKVGEDFGFDGHFMYMADQKDQNGSWFEISEDYVEANPNGWSDIPEDILIVTDKVPGVVIGHPIADCPVVMAFDRRQGVAAIGHCSANLVDIKMPMLVVDALLDSYRSSDQDIIAYVSMCAGINWTYKNYPKWAKDEKMWKDAITLDKDGLYHIDLKRVVRKQLLDRNVSGLIMSPVDTITDSDYYSNSAASNGNKAKSGRNFAGTFFADRERGPHTKVLYRSR